MGMKISTFKFTIYDNGLTKEFIRYMKLENSDVKDLSSFCKFLGTQFPDLQNTAYNLYWEDESKDKICIIDNTDFKIALNNMKDQCIIDIVKVKPMRPKHYLNNIHKMKYRSYIKPDPNMAPPTLNPGAWRNVPTMRVNSATAGPIDPAFLKMMQK